MYGSVSNSTSMILFRAHNDTPRLGERLAFLQQTSGMRVVCAFDEGDGEKRGFEDQPRLTVGSMTNDRLGLGADQAMSWRCGDYCFYAARMAFPEISHFWLVEYDVLFSYKRASEFFSRFADCPEIDFLAARVGLAKNWGWADTMDASEGPIYRSFFPVTRMSARAADHCLKQRRAAFANHTSGREWPNDEVFIPTTLFRDGFMVKDLNLVARVYEKMSYNFSIPRRYEYEARKVRNRVMHPVLDAGELALKPHASKPRTLLHAAKRYLSVFLDS